MAIERARAVTADDVRASPLLRLDVDAPCEVWLKLECLHPIGSFKLRGAASAIRQAQPEEWREGVWTTSAGNMAQGVCTVARELGVPATVVAPDHAPRAKLEAIARLGGHVIAVPFDTWWQTMESGAYPGLNGFFVHPVLDERVMAGNGVIGLELVEQLGEVDAVLVPWGGGGLASGIACALRAVSPGTRVIACEPASAAPLTASLAAGKPVEVDYRPSFVDGAGSKAVLPAMWERGRELLAGAVAVPLDEVAAAVRLLATRAHVVAEGAGALALAAALAGHGGEGRVVSVVSGGNIDPERLGAILAGRVPD